MRLRVFRLDPSVPLPVYSSAGAAAFDLSAAEDVDIPPREIRLIGTGLVISHRASYWQRRESNGRKQVSLSRLHGADLAAQVRENLNSTLRSDRRATEHTETQSNHS